MNLTTHFTEAEAGITQDTPPEHRAAMVALLSTIVEPIRDHVGMPLFINRPKQGIAMRGWRPPSSTVGSPTSQHRLGQAIDFDLGGADLVPVWRWIAWSSGLPFGQVILERSNPGAWGWIHVSLGEPFRARNRSRQVMFSPDAKNYVAATPSTVLPR